MIELGVEKEVQGFTRIATRTLEKGIVVTLLESNRNKNYGLMTFIADRDCLKVTGSITVNSQAGIDDVLTSMQSAFRYHELLRESFGRETLELEHLLNG